MRRETNPCARELFQGCCKLKQCNAYVTTRAAIPALVCRGLVFKRLGSRFWLLEEWLKFKNPNAPAVKREAEEDWGKER